MYETIRELPLFKGISEDQVSLFLEKTSVDFRNFEDGEVISEPDHKVTSLYFILKGKVIKIHNLRFLPITIEETLEEGNVLGAFNLYGLSTHFPYKCLSSGKVSLMIINKDQYMNLLQSDGIYILNFINLLSAATQRPILNMLNAKNNSVGLRIYELLTTICSPSFRMATIKSEVSVLSRFSGVSEQEIKSWLEEKSHSGIIEYDKDRIMIKKDKLKQLI